MSEKLDQMIKQLCLIFHDSELIMKLEYNVFNSIYMCNCTPSIITTGLRIFLFVSKIIIPKIRAQTLEKEEKN